MLVDFFRSKLPPRNSVPTATKTFSRSPVEDSDMPSSTNEPSLAALPSELIHHILTYLPARDLLALALTNHQIHNQTKDEGLWKALAAVNLPPPGTASDHLPFTSWRNLYLAYYPYWFLTRQKIWIADTPHSGKLVVIRYDPRRGCIEGYQLVAHPGYNDYTEWAWNPDVIIHTFHPMVRLHLDNPEMKLNHFDKARIWPSNWQKGDLPMVTGQEHHHIFSDLVLAKEVPEQNVDRKMILWPPRSVPSTHHVRASTGPRDNYRSAGHKPQHLDEISQHAFRLRKRAQFITHHLPLQNLLSSEETSTFSTLDPKLYTPTPKKPWRGIWVGDYAGHGCEFLLVMQPDDEVPSISSPPSSPSSSSSSIDTPTSSHTTGSFPSNSYTYAFNPESRYIPASIVPLLQHTLASSRSPHPPPPDPEGIYHGRLEALKLTGDPNVPRGEFTWVADDIGPGGFVRTCGGNPTGGGGGGGGGGGSGQGGQEPGIGGLEGEGFWGGMAGQGQGTSTGTETETERELKGARVVASRGHVAAREFVDGMYFIQPHTSLFVILYPLFIAF
ncbi:MAG: hypothetical protein Q9160_004374 [Pyrenula sp. 1 TL-2023]